MILRASSTTAVQNAQDCDVHKPQASSSDKMPRMRVITPKDVIPAMMLKMAWIPITMAMIVMPRGRCLRGDIYIGHSLFYAAYRSIRAQTYLSHRCHFPVIVAHPVVTHSRIST